MSDRTNGVNSHPDGDPRRPAGETIPLDRALDELRRDHPQFFATPPGPRRSRRRRHHSYPICLGWRRYLSTHCPEWAMFPPAAKRVVRAVWIRVRHRRVRYRLARFERFIARFEIRHVE